MDIDGTIITYNEDMPEPHRKALFDARAAGHHVVLATGRTVLGTLNTVKALDLYDVPLVCSNGAVVATVHSSAKGDFTIERAITFDPTTALDALYAKLPDAAYAVEKPGHGMMVTDNFPSHEIEGEITVMEFDKLKQHMATRVIARSVNHSAEEFQEVAEAAGLHGVNYYVGWTAWMDISPNGISKATSLELVREQLNVPREYTRAFGDGRNDLEMFEWAHHATAMGQAVDIVQQTADHVTASVDDHGLALAISRVLAEYQ